MTKSPLEELAALDDDQVQAVLASWTDEEAAELENSWADLLARPEQLPPEGDWRFWAIITGRGWGKNRTASEWILDRCKAFADADHGHLIGLFGRTDREVGGVQIGGDSGLRRCAERRGWQVHGARTALEAQVMVPKRDGSWHVSDIEVHSGGDPDRCRGRNFHTVHADEFASWKHTVDVEGNTAFTNMNFGLRALCPPGLHPQGIVTTTPKPIPVVKAMLMGAHGPTHVTRGTLLDNKVNLDPQFIEAIMGAYAGTRLEAQEIYGEVLESVEGALWTMQMIHRWRVRWDRVPDISHIVIGVDPSGSDQGDECGIVACGKARERDGKGRAHGYVLEDASLRNRPAEWGPQVVELYWQMKELYPNARVEVVFEINFGGQMGVDTLKVRDPSVPVRQVTATRAKRVRAEPVAMLYDQGRWHHVGVFPELEEQMCWWTPLEPSSPDRMDALVWSAIGLLPELTIAPSSYAKGFGDRRA